jgi:D-sedoheptulose 7-phosphate isomerase
METTAIWKSCFAESARCLEQLSSSAEHLELCGRFSRLIAETIRGGGNLYACGNGGSHCDAMHFAEEFTGRYRGNRRPVGALALGDPSHTTCVANDYGFEHVFSRQIEGLGRAGDLLIGFSTSGNSKNLLMAFEAAKKKGIRTAALLGRGGGALKNVADLAIVVPGETADRIQELHIKIVHIAIEAVEREIFPENYK